MATKVYLNDSLVDQEQTRIHSSNPAFLHGVGLFETVRAYHGCAFRLSQHIARMRASAKALSMPVEETLARIPEAVTAVLQANGLSDARVRFTVTPPSPSEPDSPGTLLVAAQATDGYPAELYTQGMTVHVCDRYRQSRLDPLVGHKTTSYFSRLLVLRNGQDRACGESLWFTPDNYLAEGCMSNVFLVKDSRLRTPPLDTPILPGVTRAAVLEIAAAENLPADQAPCTIKDLLDADEVFLTNAIMEVMPVTRIERKEIADAKPGPITRKLMANYRDLVERETA